MRRHKDTYDKWEDINKETHDKSDDINKDTHDKSEDINKDTYDKWEDIKNDTQDKSVAIFQHHNQLLLSTCKTFCCKSYLYLFFYML